MLRRVLLIGLMASGKSTLARLLARELGLSVCAIDAVRRRYADGSVSGEYLARALFLRRCETREAIFEYSGASIHNLATRHALRQGPGPLLVGYLRLPPEEAHARFLARRATPPPFAPFAGPPDLASFVSSFAQLEREAQARFWQDGPGWRAVTLDAAQPPEALRAALLAG